MVRDSVQLETAVNTISHEYLLEFTSEYGISEMLHPELPGPGDRIVDFPEGKVGWMSFSKRPGKNTPQCYTKPLDSLKNWNNRFFWVDECIFPTAVDWRKNASKDGIPANGTYSVEAVMALDTYRTPIQKQQKMLLCLVEMDLFSLIRAPNPTKVKTGSRPRAPHELPLLTLIAPPTDSSGVPSTIERSPFDFDHEAEASGRETVDPEMPPPEDAVETDAVEPPAVRESRKRGHEGTDANAPPKSLRRDHADLRPSGSSRRGKSLAANQLCLASNVFVSEGVPADVSDFDPLAFVDSPSPHPADVAHVAVAGDPESENVSSPAEVGSPRSVYRPEWGVTNGSLFDNPEACQDLVDNAAPSGGSPRPKNPSSGVRNKEPGSAAGDRGRDLKAAFEDYKRQQDQMVEQRCAEMDARLDALSVDFDEELYPHILTAIAGLRWVIGHGLRLAMMKCAESLKMRHAFADVVLAGVAKGMSEGLKHVVEHGRAQLTVESLEAYDPEAEAKFAAALQSLKDLKYPLLDQLEGLKDAPMDVIMASLYLESDTGGMPHNLYATSALSPLSSPSRYIQRSDRVPVSAPIVVPQGLALLLVDATTQTEFDDA
nr:transposase (putative), gypsy type [Tanacetum cinerariifolium]